MADQPTTQKLTAGRIVQYVVSDGDVGAIHQQRGEPPRGMNDVHAGDVLPAIVVRPWSDTCANLQVFLDGPATYWATSRTLNPDGAPGSWHWPARA